MVQGFSHARRDRAVGSGGARQLEGRERPVLRGSQDEARRRGERSARDGTTAEFKVTKVERYDKSAFPTDAVYGDVATAQLRMITCGGAFDAGPQSYRDNIVVYAEMA